MNRSVKRTWTAGCVMAVLILLSAVLPADVRSIVIDAVDIETRGVNVHLLVVPTMDPARRRLAGQAGQFVPDIACGSTAMHGSERPSRRRVIITDRFILVVTTVATTKERCVTAAGTEDAVGGKGECPDKDASSPIAAVRRIVERHVRRISALVSCCLDAALSIVRSLAAKLLMALFS